MYKIMIPFKRIEEKKNRLVRYYQNVIGLRLIYDCDKGAYCLVVIQVLFVHELYQGMEIQKVEAC